MSEHAERRSLHRGSHRRAEPAPPRS